MKKLNYAFAILAFSLVSIVACNNSEKKENTLKVGVVSGPEKELAETAKKVAKEKFNLDVELVAFNDYVVPNEALNQGDIDVNVFQHQPYLQEQSKQRGFTKLTIVGNTFVFPIVAYSKKIKSITELQPGASIAIPNDPTNGGRSLLLLQREGIIGLKENVGIQPKVTDIVSNPKQVKIIEMEAPQLPRVLDDPQVTIAIINNSFAAQAGLDPEKQGLFTEDKESPYVNLIVARSDNKNDEKVQQFIQAYQSPEVEATAKKSSRMAPLKAGKIFKIQVIASDQLCPCGSGNTFGECCQQIHRFHAKATTAEALMSARYSAFVTQQIDFLYDTFHPSTRRFQNKQAIGQWARDNKWMQLAILKSTLHTVEFEAHYLDPQMEVHIHHEKSTFKKQGDLWYYVDGR